MRNFRPYYKKKTTQYYHLNYRIPNGQVRVLDVHGKQIGVMSRDEAVQKARSEELDLVLIAPKAVPPVAKITDFKKFLYEEEKKLKEAKKGAKKSIVKDLKLSLFIGPADFERVVKRGREFLDDGNQLRLNLTLRGREIVKKQMAFELINKYIALLGESINVSKEPRLEGRVIRAVISSKK